MKRKTGIILNVVALTYLMLPIILFAFGWLRIYYACTITTILLIALFISLKDMADVDISFGIKEVNILLATCILVMLWVGFSGIGGFSFQNRDHEIRNAIFRDLVQYPWPVVYHYSGEQSGQSLAGHDGALVYYIAYWLPAALMGKLFGWEVAKLVLYLWTVLGVVLSLFYFSFYVRKKNTLVAAVFFILWSGLDVLGLLLRQKHFSVGAHIEWWASYFQYSSNTTTLFWVFNQTIVPWLVVMLLLNQQNNKNILFLFALCVPYAPLPSIGLLPFVAYWALFRRTSPKVESMQSQTKISKYFQAFAMQVRHILTFQNIVVPLTLGAFISSYFMVNSYIGDRYHGLLFFTANPSPRLLLLYLFFCIMEFGLYVLIVFSFYKKDPLFLITAISLVLIPWYFAGVNNDFAMRASIPPLVILSAYALRYFFEDHIRMNKLLLVIFLGIGSVTPFNEIYRSVTMTSWSYSDRLADHVQSLSKFQYIRDVGPFVAIDPEHSFFFKYFAKSPLPR